MSMTQQIASENSYYINALNYYLANFDYDNEFCKKYIASAQSMLKRLQEGQELTPRDLKEIEGFKVISLYMEGKNNSEKNKQRMQQNLARPESGEPNFCVYHGLIHTTNYNHSLCQDHCNLPKYCLHFKTCPIHEGGKNMLLALEF